MKGAIRMIQKLYYFFKDRLKLDILAKIIAILIIIYLFSLNGGIFASLKDITYQILKPFIFGFVIAYVFEPLVLWFEQRNIKRGVVIPILWIVLLISIFIFFLILIPMLYSKLNGFVESMIKSVEWISNQIILFVDYEDFSLINTITSTTTSFLSKYDSWLPQIVTNIPTLMSVISSFIADSIFTIIISIYIQFDFKRIRMIIKKVAEILYKDSGDYLKEIDVDLQVYLKSMLIMLVIRLVEYCLFYAVLGHSDWFIIGVITSVACIIPYIGGTIANVLGILTALTLPQYKIIIMIAGLVLLSNLDGYVISPIVHKKRSAVGPLLSLLVIFAGGTLLGILGVMISLPLVIAIRSCFEVYERKHGKLLDNMS